MIKHALALLSLVCGLTLTAQTGSVPATPRTFRFIGLEGDLSNLEMPAGHNDSIKLVVPLKNFSPAYSCPDSGGIVLFRWITGIDERGLPRKIKKRMADIPIPSGHEPFLILLKEVNEPKNPYPLQGLPLSDSLKDYPTETIRVVNLTKEHLAVKFEAETKQIPLDGFEAFPFPASFRMCPFQIAYDKTGAWSLAYDSFHGIKRRQRALALVCDNPNPPNDMIGPLLVDVIKDRVPLTINSSTPYAQNRP